MSHFSYIENFRMKIVFHMEHQIVSTEVFHGICYVLHRSERSALMKT